MRSNPNSTNLSEEKISTSDELFDFLEKFIEELTPPTSLEAEQAYVDAVKLEESIKNLDRTNKTRAQRY